MMKTMLRELYEYIVDDIKEHATIWWIPLAPLVLLMYLYVIVFMILMIIVAGVYDLFRKTKG